MVYSFIQKDIAGLTGIGKDHSFLISNQYLVLMLNVKKMKLNGGSYVIKKVKNVLILVIKYAVHYHVLSINLNVQELPENKLLLLY